MGTGAERRHSCQKEQGAVFTCGQGGLPQGLGSLDTRPMDGSKPVLHQITEQQSRLGPESQVFTGLKEGP